MGRILSAVGRFVKAAAVLVLAAVKRIAYAEGEGVIEKAIQNAAAEVAGTYVRSVSGGSGAGR